MSMTPTLTCFTFLSVACIWVINILQKQKHVTQQVLVAWNQDMRMQEHIQANNIPQQQTHVCQQRHMAWKTCASKQTSVPVEGQGMKDTLQEIQAKANDQRLCFPSTEMRGWE
eukprot:scaffold84798_cov18-Tisochrysis_lutea.AAC.1